MNSQTFLNPNSPKTLVELLLNRAQSQPQKLAYTFLGDGETESARLTYQQLGTQVQATAAYLQSMTSPGDPTGSD